MTPTESHDRQTKFASYHGSAADNADEGQPPTIIAAYRSCMSNKISSNETLAITAWDKTHPAERKACSAEAGWK